MERKYSAETNPDIGEPIKPAFKGPRLVKNRDSAAAAPAVDDPVLRSRREMEHAWNAFSSRRGESLSGTIRNHFEKLVGEQLGELQEKTGTKLSKGMFERLNADDMRDIAKENLEFGSSDDERVRGMQKIMYKSHIVEADIADLKRAQHDFPELSRSKRLAIEQEKLIALAFNIWFKNKGKTILTSDWDDWIHDTDLAQEFSKEDLVLAIDTTAYERPGEGRHDLLGNKISDTAALIANNQENTLKYYDNLRGGHGEKTTIVVVVMDNKSLFELNYLLRPDSPDKLQAFEKSPAQLFVLEQMLIQLRGQLSWSKKKNPHDSIVTKKIERYLPVIESLRAEKIAQGISPSDYSEAQQKILEEITEACKHM